MPKQTEGKQDHHEDVAAALSAATSAADGLHLLAAQMTDAVVALRSELARAAVALNAVPKGGER